MDRHSRCRKYDYERQMCRLDASAVDISDYHPLKAITVRHEFILDCFIFKAGPVLLV